MPFLFFGKYLGRLLVDPDQTFVEPLLVPGRVERGARLVEGGVPGPDEGVRHPGHHPGRADRRQVALELLTLPARNGKNKMRALGSPMINLNHD